MNKLVVNCGGMFSGKTSALLQQGERYLRKKAGKVLYVKPANDKRFSESEIVTHNGIKVEAVVMPTYGLSYTVGDYDIILIDEVQFFEEGIVEDIKALLRKGKTVHVAGLDMDYKGEPFEITTYLMGIADEVNKFRAVCEECGNDATFSARIIDCKERIDVGGAESYSPRCRSCFNKMRKG